MRAEVKADGTLSLAGRQGSIHRLGAEVQGKSACNGWTFWHFEAEGVRKPIDALREEARRQLGLSAPAAFSGNCCRRVAGSLCLAALGEQDRSFLLEDHARAWLREAGLLEQLRSSAPRRGGSAASRARDP